MNKYITLILLLIFVGGCAIEQPEKYEGALVIEKQHFGGYRMRLKYKGYPNLEIEVTKYDYDRYSVGDTIKMIIKSPADSIIYFDKEIGDNKSRDFSSTINE